MDNKDDLKSGRIFYASPWIFAAACALLTLIIGVFAVNNYQREKELMGVALIQEGQAVLNLVSSGSRAAVRRAMMRSEMNTATWLQSVQQVIENGSEHPGIIALFLVDWNGRILAHNDLEQTGNQADQQTVDFLKGVTKENPRKNNRIKNQPEDKDQVFQIAALFNPLGFREAIPQPFREMARSRMGRMMRERELPPEYEHYFNEIAGLKYYLVAELDMADFQQSVHKQFMQIIILSIVLLLVGIGGFLSLITLQGFRGAQMRLKRISAFTEVLVSSLPLGLIALGADGRIRTCNKSACAIAGLKHDDVQGQDPEKVLPKPLAEIIFDSGPGRNQEHREISLDDGSGSEKLLHITRLNIEDSEKHHTGTMLLIQDVSELRKLEIELQRNERHAALGKMAAGVAHELRNPLSSIKGLALLLKSKFVDDTDDRETADILVSEVERLNRSISELLDYTRADLPERTEVYIDEIIRKAVVLIQSDAEAAGVIVSSDYQTSHCPIGVDRDKLTQVLLNLFLNGLQAMPEGGQLNISTKADSNHLTIKISDTGIGIAPEIMDKVFDPYFTTKNDGTGLGLSLSAKIIEDHQGTITIDGVTGRGTTVTIRFPVY